MGLRPILRGAAHSPCGVDASRGLGTGPEPAPRASGLRVPPARPAFMPPELFELCMVHDGYNPDNELIYDQSVDVWGLGVVGCMLVTGSHPLKGLRTWQEFLSAMREGRLTAFDAPCWAPVSEPCKDLLRSILQPTPEKRATPAQILAHVWVAGGAAPVEQLQHAVEGIRHLRLRGLQKIVLQMMETRLHKDQLAETTKLFEQLDVDKTGFVRRHEVAQVLRQQEKQGSDYARHVDICFDALDLKGDGVVSLHEFRAGVLAQHSQLMDSLLGPIFEEIDEHRTGDISADEVVDALHRLGGGEISQEEAQALLNEFDLDGTGRLNLSEFTKMMSNESMRGLQTLNY
eukprot:Transcript_28048.p2 GENE.Transcript_28048~~Transcript_28048.p2  ORF type:complete len:345 (-),score=140.73 Transcript_28048:1347-2381(-)